MRSKPAIVVVLLGCIFVFGTGIAAEPDAKTLIVGSEQNFPPFALGDSAENASGFSVELWHDVARHSHLQYELRVQPFHQILQDFQSGRIDVLINLAQSDERRNFADFSVPHTIVNGAIFVRKHQSGIETEADLADKSLIVMKSDLAHDYAVAQGWQKNLILVDTIAHGFELLSTGQHDAMMTSKLAGLQTLQRLGITNVRVLDENAGYSQKFSFAVRKGESDLLASINEGLAVSKAGGTYDDLYETWFGIYETRSLPAFLIALPLLLAAIFIGIYINLYRRRRAERIQAALSLQASQRALIESEHKLNVVLDNVSAYIYLKDLQGRYLYANRLVRELFHASLDEIVGNGDEKFFNREHAEMIRANDARVLARGEIFRAEETHAPIGTGKTTTYWSVKIPLRHEDGEIYALLGISTDITERKIAEQRERDRAGVLEQLAGAEPLPRILESIVRNVEQENPQMLCSVLLLDDTRQHLHTAAAPSLPDAFNQAVNGETIGEGKGSCGTAAFTGHRVIVDDIRTHPYWRDYKHLAESAGLAACWSEPILDSEGRVLGTFAIYHRQPSRPNQQDIALIEHAATLAGIAIERSLAQESLKLAAMVYQNTSEAMMITDAENRIIAINPAFTELTGYPADRVLGKDPSILSSGRHDDAFYQDLWNNLNLHGHWQGEVWNRRSNGEEYVEWLTINTIYSDDGKVLRRVALFSDITEKKKVDELVWLQANYDTLTQLPNRRLFMDRLAQEIRKAHREKQQVALLFLDLDRFKEVNDTLGHHMGDELLIIAAQRIRACVRDSDTVARLGGDEFTIIIPELADVSNVGRVAQNIISSLSTYFQLETEQAYVSASIGITVYPEDADNVEDMLKNADQAMYAAKSAGRSCYRFFTHSMQQSAQLRMRLSRDLIRALQEDEFMVYYQPIVALSDNRIHKAEALLRWQHPTQGFISPTEFIPIAEDIGAIHNIGNWVFAQVTAQLVKWKKRYGPDFQISINKSPAQFHADGKTHDVWLDMLLSNDLNGSNIAVEITEGLLLNADASITEKLLNFSEAGIQVAIDDFGTGYSSLAYLKRFDIDYLKIDQSFIHNLSEDSSDYALCEAIVVMAHKLELKVIAEGVETEEQRRLLCAIGCDYAQGYLFARPVPAEEFETLMAAQLH